MDLLVRIQEWAQQPLSQSQELAFIVVILVTFLFSFLTVLVIGVKGFTKWLLGR